MQVFNKKKTLRIKDLMVAIMSALLVLTLVTTISLGVCVEVMAEGENGSSDDKKTEQGAEDEKTDKESSGDEESDKKDDKDDKDKKDEEKDGEKEGEDKAEETADETEDEDLPADPSDTGLDLKPVMPEVTSDSYIVMSGSTSEVVIEKHSTRKMSPGRITMLVTAMVVIDNMYDANELNNTVEITEKLASYGDDFKEGESVTVGDLLNAMLVGGSEQAAEALSRYSASKRKVFIKEMNSKAMALELMDTQFNNPSGAYDTKQYASAHDCAVIVQAAMRYQLIKDALMLRNTTAIAKTKKNTRKVLFKSTNPLLVSEKPSEVYKFTKGGISGALGSPVNASQYAGVATVDDMQLIVVLMNSKASRVAYEAKGLLVYGDTKVTKNAIVKAGKKVGTVRVRGGARTRAAAYTETNGFVYVPPEGTDSLIDTQVILYSDIEAPLREGDKVGEYRIFVADELKGTVDLIVKSNIPRGWFPSKYYISNAVTIGIGVVLLLILMFFLRIQMIKRRRARIKAARRERKIREIALRQMEVDEDRRKRDWTYGDGSYDQLAPRTSDLRKAAVEAELEKADKAKRKDAKTDKKRAAAKEKALKEKEQSQEQQEDQNKEE